MEIWSAFGRLFCNAMSLGLLISLVTINVVRAADTCCYNPWGCTLSEMQSLAQSTYTQTGDNLCCPSGGDIYILYDDDDSLEGLCRCGDMFSWTQQTCPYTVSDASPCLINGTTTCNVYLTYDNTVSMSWFCAINHGNSEYQPVPQDCPTTTTPSPTTPAPTAPTTATPTVGCNSDEYKCSNGRCIPTSYICDNWDDCTDGVDETNCPTTSTPTTSSSPTYSPITTSSSPITTTTTTTDNDVSNSGDINNVSIYTVISSLAVIVLFQLN